MSTLMNDDRDVARKQFTYNDSSCGLFIACPSCVIRTGYSLRIVSSLDLLGESLEKVMLEVRVKSHLFPSNLHSS